MPMSEATAEWRAGRIPLVSAVSYADGHMLLLTIEHYGLRTLVRPLAETALESFLAFNPDWWAEVTPTVRLDLPGGDYVATGEGPNGSDGFVALCSQQGELRFSIFLDGSNPFVQLSFDAPSRSLTASNNLGERWIFDVEQPWIVRVEADDVRQEP
jgi:hypothetical protein